MSTPSKWTWTQRIGLVGGIPALAAVVLRAMGRTPWGAANGPGFWVGSPRGSLTSQVLFDPYALTHVSHGLVFFYLFSVLLTRYSREAQFGASLLLEAIWEIVENTPYVIDRFRQTTAATEYTGDSILNSLGDLLAAALGFVIAVQVVRRTRRGWVLALFLLVEALSALWIRDGMLLTTLMLIYPIPGIREWQAG
jgi:hypothetical protein